MTKDKFTRFTNYEHYGDCICIRCNCGNEIWTDPEDEEIHTCDCGRVYRTVFSLSVTVKEPEAKKCAS